MQLIDPSILQQRISDFIETEIYFQTIRLPVLLLLPSMQVQPMSDEIRVKFWSMWHHAMLITRHFLLTDLLLKIAFAV